MCTLFLSEVAVLPGLVCVFGCVRRLASRCIPVQQLVLLSWWAAAKALVVMAHLCTAGMLPALRRAEVACCDRYSVLRWNAAAATLG